MMLIDRELQEKCMPLYQVFVDLTKAFDTINCDGLWRISGKIGCPPSFFENFRQLHCNMTAQVAGGSLNYIYICLHLNKIKLQYQLDFIV